MKRKPTNQNLRHIHDYKSIKNDKNEIDDIDAILYELLSLWDFNCPNDPWIKRNLRVFQDRRRRRGYVLARSRYLGFWGDKPDNE